MNVAGAAFDAFPGFRVENLRRFGVGELQGVHAVRFSGEVEGIEPEAGDGLALVGIELDFEAHPGAIVHADIPAAGGDELADLGFREIDALDVDDDAQVEPVDVLTDDFEAHGGGDGVGEDRLEAQVDIQFDVRRHCLDPLGKFFRELFGDAGFEREQFLIIGKSHVIQDGWDWIEGLAGETQQLLALDRLLFFELPTVLGEAFGAAALGLDGGDVDDKVLGLCGGETGHQFHLELRLELQIDDAFLK